MAVLILFAAAIPVSLSVWALLDAASRPAWAWSFAGKSQLGWLVAICIGLLTLVIGLGVSFWYLTRIRPSIRAVEAGDLGESSP